MIVSVADFAKKHGKSVQVTRNYAASGKLKTAVKIGNSWGIDDQEPWPDDNRIKDGKYIGVHVKKPE